MPEFGNESRARATNGSMLFRQTCRWVRALSLCAPGLLAAGCAGHSTSTTPELSKGSRNEDAPLTLASGEVGRLAAIPVKVADLQGRSVDIPLEPKQPIGPLSYPEAVRLRDWQAALRFLDAAPAKEQARPEVRYLRGRVLLELGDPERALIAVKDLEADAPMFAAEVRQLRAEAHLAAGHTDEVVAFYGTQSDVPSWLVAARALADAERWAEARVWADKIVAASMKQRSQSVRAEARALRARIAEAQGHRNQAILDYRWLALDGATQAAAVGADEALERLDAKQRLTRQQRMQRAEAFAEAGALENVERELELLKDAPGPKVDEADTVAVLARAYYRSRRDYARAAELYGRAAKLSPVGRDRNSYFEASSLSRAHRDSEAIEKYEALVKRFPRSGWADSAQYSAARLRFIDGQWQAAVKAYEDYLKRRPNGRNVESVNYELAVARLAAGQFAQAEVELRLLRSKTKSAFLVPRLLQLEGVAQQGAGKRSAAVETFRRVIAERPLSFEALAAAARLRQLGEPEPPLIAPAPPEPPPEPVRPTLPDKVARLHAVGLDAEAEEQLRQHESELRREYGVRSGEALCQTYGQLRSARRRYQIAHSAVSSDALAVAPSPATAWQWDCIYPQPYEKVVARAEEEHSLPQHFIYAVMRQESAFSATVESPAGAVGLMQIIDPTARNIASELDETYDPSLMRAPAVNVRFGAYYLRRLLDMFGEQPYLAAAAYNAGPHAATRWLHAGEELPLDVFVARIPYTETRGYVYRVMGNWARYTYLAGGADAVPRLSLEIPRGLRAPADAY